MEGWRSGRSFLVRLARDSRKWNLAALVASQNPQGHPRPRRAEPRLHRLRRPDRRGPARSPPRRSGCSGSRSTTATRRRWPRCPRSTRPRRHRLGFREFVMRDVDGRVQKVRVDVSYVDGLLDHLDTTPAAAAAGRRDMPTVLVRPGGVTWRGGRVGAGPDASLVLGGGHHRLAGAGATPARAAPPAPAQAAGGALQHRGVAGRLPRLRRPARPRSPRDRAGLPQRHRPRAHRTPAWPAGSPSGPTSSTKPGPQGIYSEYGYAGYSFTTYDLEGGCASTLIDAGLQVRDHRRQRRVHDRHRRSSAPRTRCGNAPGIRRRCGAGPTRWSTRPPRRSTRRSSASSAWSPSCVVGLYLLWRSRQADMGSATTTAGWAILVMVAVTAIAAWPVQSANIADATLVTTLGVVHDAVGPRAQDTPAGQVRRPRRPDACDDNRPPAVRASDTATETMLYRNWLRGVLGSADSETAQKYGRGPLRRPVALLGRSAEASATTRRPATRRSTPRSSSG